MERNRRIIGFLLACLMMCTPCLYKFAVKAEDAPLTLEEVMESQSEKINAHPENYYIDNPSEYVGYKAVFNFDALHTSQLFYQVSDGALTRGSVGVNNSELVDANGDSIVVEITGYYQDENMLLFEIEPIEGYSLPEKTEGYSYVLQSYSKYDQPSLLFIPKEGIFVNDEVTIYRTLDTASRSLNVDTSTVPEFFNVSYVYCPLYNDDEQTDLWNDDWYELLDADNWNMELSNLHYVFEEEVELIPAQVSIAYKSLMETTSSEEYNSVLSTIPQAIVDQFTEKHLTNLEKHQIEIDEQLQNALNDLLSSTTTTEYYDVLRDLNDEIIAKLEEVYGEQLQQHLDELIRLDNIEHHETVSYNGYTIPVTVKGRIPENGVTLSVEPVTFDTIVDEGFDIENETNVVFALDIKIINDADGSQWQPEAGQTIEVKMDVGEGPNQLGLEDGSVYRLHHKHDDVINSHDIFLVLDGAITYYTNGFSIYVVDNFTQTSSATQITPNNNGTPKKITLSVGDRVIYYANPQYTPTDGSWYVTDPAGAIYYTVNGAGVGNEGTLSRWIEIVALRETGTNYVDLNFRYLQNNYNNTLRTESYQIEIVTPSAKIGDKAIYIKDEVNTSGRITARLVDKNGNDISDQLAGASFSWTRRDDVNGDFFISPKAYENDNMSINIARDHAGLVEARKNSQGKYVPTVYTVTIRLADSTTLTANYTVYYQSEIINSKFETPNASESTYTFFTNGTPDLYWKTTAPGEGGNLTRDIEFGDVTNNSSGDTEFGVKRAADWRPEDGSGVQFAELNAEAFGALYQDMISVPGETLEWSFMHAPRKDGSAAPGSGQQPAWDYNISNAMFIVMGATEEAQKITTQDQLEDLTNAALVKDRATLEAGGMVTVDYTNEVDYTTATYSVWYHDAGTISNTTNTTNLDDVNNPYGTAKNYGWTLLEGEYQIPANSGQYRTRLFFVSKTSDNENSKNAGNLIDAAQAGQYKSYVVEYFEETFVGGNGPAQKVATHFIDSKTGTYIDQDGLALIYSSIELVGLDRLITKDNDFLHKILINGENYPYEVRHLDPNTGKEVCSVYVESYPKTSKLIYPILKDGSTTEYKESPHNYADYDLVIQVFVRDTVVAVEKIVELPAELTVEQKLKIFDDLNNGEVGVDDDKDGKIDAADTDFEGGYDVTFTLESTTPIPELSSKFSDSADLRINLIDPKGQYTGYVAPNSNPPLGYNYTITETLDVTNINGHQELGYIPGLELDSVKFTVTRYRYGEGSNIESDLNNADAKLSKEYSKANGLLTPTATLQCTPFELKEDVKVGNVVTEPGYKIAEVVVKNTYKEKMTTIHYKAIGNGKLKWIGGTDFVDYPTEELAFYSGVAKGCEVHAGQGAVFAGWYKDEACTIKVEDIDGKYDKNTNSFIPNANIINTDEITYYAKFETKSIVINRTNGDPYQTYIYRVQGTGGSGATLDTYVSLTCDANGNGSVEVIEILNQEVTVTEISDWSWRFDNPYNKSITKPLGDAMKVNYDFTSPINFNYWINGYTKRKNTYGKEVPES